MSIFLAGESGCRPRGGGAFLKAIFEEVRRAVGRGGLDAFREAGKVKQRAARVWLESLKGIALQDVQVIFEQIPRDRISEVAIDFALKMLQLNRQRLLGLYEVLR